MGIRGAALLVAGLALVAACAGDPEQPRSLPPVTTEASPTASASPSAAPVPTEAQAPTPQGAAEFARFFYAQVARGFQTASPELVGQLSLPSCEACSKYVDSIASVRADGLRVEGGDFEILFAVSPSDDDPARARVDVGWNFAQAKYFDASGRLVETGPAVPGVEETMQLVREGESWMVESLVQVKRS